jgi:aminotransferase
MTNLAPLSKRTAHLREASILRALTLKVSALDDGINLGQGVCDLEMPRPLRLAAVESIFQDRATYTPYGGVRPLREQIVRRMEERYGLTYGMDEIVVTVGSSMAYTSTLMTLVDPGDEVVLFEPFYPYHYTGARLAGAEVRTVRLSLGEDGIDWQGLQASLSPRTRLLVLNTPSNPLGKVWTQAELDRLAHLLEGSPTHVVTDEIYEDLVYDGRTHVPPATHPGLAERTITISGVSKSFSVTGWRLGWVAAPKRLSGAIGPVFDVLAVCAARPLQQAAAAALRELPETYYTDLRDGYARRRTLLCDALRAGGFRLQEPEGSYYVLADYSERWPDLSPEAACFRLLEEARIAAIPSTIFYAREPAPPELRFQFAVEEPVLEEVARRLRR